MKMFRFFTVPLFLALAFWVASCSNNSGGGSGATGGASTDVSYNGPGSYWQAAIKTDGTFTISYAEEVGGAIGMTIGGTYERLESGFLELTVGSVEAVNPSQAPSVGDKAQALEVPGFALFVKPLDGDEVIPMLSAGECPTGAFNANWSIVQNTEPRDTTDPGQDWFGTFAYDANGGSPTASVTSMFALEGFTPVTNNGGGFNSMTCTDGIIELLENGKRNANIFTSSAGAALVETFEEDPQDANNVIRNSTIMALPPTPIEASDLSGTFAALVIQEESDGQGGIESSVFPVQITMTDGVGTGGALDINTNVVDTNEQVTISIAPNSTIGDGFATGTLEGSFEIACTYAKGVGENGDNLLLCNGQSPGDQKLFGIIGRKI